MRRNCGRVFCDTYYSTLLPWIPTQALRLFPPPCDANNSFTILIIFLHIIQTIVAIHFSIELTPACTSFMFPALC